MNGLTLIRRLDDWSSRVENAALALLHAAIATLVCAAVVFRYVLSYPLTWSDELILILFGWMIFLGIANAFHARTHIIIDVVVLFAPRWLAFAFGLVAFTATTVLLATLTYAVVERPFLRLRGTYHRGAALPGAAHAAP